MISKFQFQPHLIDTTLPKRQYYAQTVLADLDNDGHTEFILGQQYGDIYWYKRGVDKQWTRHLLGKKSPSDVGACTFDVDGDGWIDFVAGGAWYQNSRNAHQPFKRHIFDRNLKAVHDLVAADIDGDGQLEVLTMSDKNNLRWYKIPADPTQPWERHDIGRSVHAGLSVGDLDGDGDWDVFSCEMENVRGDRNPRFYIWENTDGYGKTWKEHVILDMNLGGHATLVGDMTGNGSLDMLTKPWRASPKNALDGKMYVLFLENVSFLK